MSTNVATATAILPSFAFFFFALPYLPLIVIPFIMYYCSFRPGSRALARGVSSGRRQKKRLLQAGKKSSINTPCSNRNQTTPSWLELVL